MGGPIRVERADAKDEDSLHYFHLTAENYFCCVLAAPLLSSSGLSSPHPAIIALPLTLT